MNKKLCFFIGHREVPDSLLPILQETIERHIEQYGVTEFIVGYYGSFDRLAAKAVIAAKQIHPEITLLLLTPYHPFEHPIKVPEGFDNTFYPPGMECVPPRLAIIRANKYMVDIADYLIAYAWHPASNSLRLISYAERRKHKNAIQITNLASPYNKPI